MLEEVHASQFGNFRIMHVFHPNIGYFRVERVHRLQKTGQNLAFADVFLPQGLRHLMVFLEFGCYLLEARKLDAEIQLVVKPLVAHALRNNSVHEQTELFLYLSDGFLSFHNYHINYVIQRNVVTKKLEYIHVYVYEILRFALNDKWFN